MKRRDFLTLLSATTTNVLATPPVNPLGKGILTEISDSLLAKSKPVKAVRFIAFGDLGTGDGAQYTLARAMDAHHQQHPYDTALLLGDNIYPDGSLAEVAAKFERPYAELLQRGIRFRAVLGNHDVRKGREAQIKYPHFNMGGRSYYSFTAGEGLVEFFALDSNNFDQMQKHWLEEALAASRAGWKVAFFHHPVYSSSGRHGSDLRLRAELEPLLVRYGVAAAFSGHDHTYERTKPQQSIQYFVSGAGGKLRRGDLNRRTPFFAAGNDETGSFMSVEITPEQFNFQAIDAAGRVIDSGEVAPHPVMRTAPIGR
jgi:3',5'-cyclic AMP phosphodiesterase CpdA